MGHRQQIKFAGLTIEISDRSDSRGFWIRCVLFTFAAHWWPRWKRLPGFCVTFWPGRGAGYVLPWRRISGFTFYLAANAKGGRKHMYSPCAFRFGVTRNANEVPYHFGGG